MDRRFFAGDGYHISSGSGANRRKLLYLFEMLVMLPEQIPEEGIIGKMQIFCVCSLNLRFQVIS